MVVEELLEFLVDKVDGYLLEAVVFEHLKASNVENSHKVGLFLEKNWIKNKNLFFNCKKLTIVESIRVSLLGKT